MHEWRLADPVLLKTATQKQYKSEKIAIMAVSRCVLTYCNGSEAWLHRDFPCSILLSTTFSRKRFKHNNNDDVVYM